jgi:hypothetical protein
MRDAVDEPRHGGFAERHGDVHVLGLEVKLVADLLDDRVARGGDGLEKLHEVALRMLSVGAALEGIRRGVGAISRP